MRRRPFAPPSGGGDYRPGGAATVDLRATTRKISAEADNISQIRDSSEAVAMPEIFRDSLSSFR